MPEQNVYSILPANRFKLDPEFVVDYIGKQPNWGFGLLSYVTFKRTYARRVTLEQLLAEARLYWKGAAQEAALKAARVSKQTTEEFWQTCVRVVEGISSVYKQHIRGTGQHWNDNEEQVHAQEMFRRMWALKFTPPGRGLWGMGTEAMEKKGSGMLNNCFSGTTLLPTLECGLVPMQQLENRHVSVFTKQGWRSAVVTSFGEQQVRRVGIKPNIKGAYGLFYEATADHRWPTLNRGDVTDLRVGDELSGVFIGEENVGDNDEYMRGRMHGALFNRNGPTCVVPFAGMPYKYIISKSQYRSLPMFDGVEDTGDDVVYYSNYSVSAVPPSGASSSYIAGFWAGLFEECGEERPHGTAVHVARKSADATWFIANAVFSAEPVVTMSGSDGAWYLLRPTDDVTFRVEEISDTGRTTTVYCPQVPVEHAFALSSGAYTGNCGFVSTQWIGDDFVAPFTRLMDFLMLGVGMGFDILGSHQNVRLAQPKITEAPFVVPDTREGWIECLRLVLGAFVGLNELPSSWDTSLIRPEGAPLATFGGTASGPGPLLRLINSVTALCYSYVDRIVDDAFIVDVMNMVGVCVVAGNVRRSSEIAIGTPKDKAFLALKDDTKIRELREKLAEKARNVQGWEELNAACGEARAAMAGISVLAPEYAELRSELSRRESALAQRLSSDSEYVRYQTELYSQPYYTHRWASNNTANCEVGATDYDELAEHTIRNGEPGYGWPEIYRAFGRMKDAPNHKDKKAMGFNPCTIAGTRILTRSGYVAIETVVGQQLDVWNGEHWAPVTPKITGHDQPLVRVELSDGTSLTCTTYHKWFLAPERTGLASTVVRAEELQPGDTLAKFEMPIVEHGDDWDNAYTHGFFCGDGQINASSGSRGALLYGEKRALASKLATTSVSAEDTYGRVYVGLPRSLPEKNVVPHNLSVKSRLAWLAGLLDADGCVLRNPHSLCLQLSSIDKAFLAEVRLMLTTLGVQAKITLEREGGLRALPNGKGGRTDYECKPCYRLLINAMDTYRLVSLGLFTHRLDLPLMKPTRDARRFVTVEAIEKVGVADTVYCFEEPITHRGTFEGIVTGQCGEQTLHDGELCCVSGDTRIQTRTGAPRIADVVGKEVEVWNGDRWSKVTPFVAARNKKLFRVTLSDGSYLDCTDDHAWQVRREGARVYKRVETRDLQKGSRVTPFELTSSDGAACDLAYEWGLFLGDGFMDRHPKIVLHGPKRAIIETGIEGTVYPEQHPEGYAEPFVRVSLPMLDSAKAAHLREHDCELPDWIFQLDRASLLELVAGWIDTDGNVSRQPNTDGYRIFGSEAKMRSLQLLLRRIGVNHASIYSVADADEVTNFGKRNYAIWCCQIPSFECGEIPTRIKKATRIGQRYAKNNAHPEGAPIDRARKQHVVSVVELDGEHTTYCFSEPENHMGVFGNVLTYQCLVETYPTRHDSLEDYLTTLKYAYRYAKGVTLIPTHDAKTNAVMVRNRRIGTSMAGIIEMYCRLGMAECKRWWDTGYKTICEWDAEYSAWLGVNESIKKTSIKPGGSTPLLVGVEGGMKLPNSRYYMRTIRIDHVSPLIAALREAGFRVEKDLTTPRTMVAYFPCKAPEGVRLGKEMSLWEQAAIFTALQSEWSDNMVSATLTFQPHERPDVARVLKVYEGQWKCVSFLPFDDHGYEQAPYIPCTEAEYVEAVRALRPVELDGNLISHEDEEKYCSGGVCELPVPAESPIGIIAS